MNKVVVYTCISGQYDSLIEPLFVNKDVDYVCFTDQPFTSNIWQIRPIPEELNYLSQVKKQRYIKVNPHKYLSDYETSVWVDANITIKGNINYLINVVKWSISSITVPKHPIRSCIYEEANACIQYNKDVPEIALKQVKEYKEEGFPENYGLVQTGIMFRKHNDPKCIKFMERWWDEIEEHSHRDQLSFNYVSWKTGINFNYIDKNIYQSDWFQLNSKHSYKSPTLIKQQQNNAIGKIYYSIPFNSQKNIGMYYNEFINLLPNDNDYAAFFDADTIVTTPDYGCLIEQVIKEHPEYDMFTCYTNRVCCDWQVHPLVDRSSNNMMYHMNFGKQLKDLNGSKIIDVTNNSLFSGMFFIVKKSAWKRIGGAITKGMLGVDNDIHKKIKKHGLKFGLITGMYVYHWYRNNNSNSINHLK